jgi:hypothetical protein
MSHQVYFGSIDPPPLVATTTSTSLDPGPLAPATTYFWRIDEVGPFGTVTGPAWSFVTGGAPCTPSEMAVDGIALGLVRGPKGTSYGKATVSVADNCGGPVAGALVTGHFTGAFAGEAPVSGTTDGSGIVSFTTSTSSKKKSFSFIVDAVILDGLVWQR